MIYKKECVLSLFIFVLLIGIVSAGSCTDTGCPDSWCTPTTENMICDGQTTNVNINPENKLYCEYGESYSSWVNITGNYPVVPSYTLLPYQDPDIVDGVGGSINPCCPIGSYYDSDKEECMTSIANFCWDYDSSSTCLNNSVVGTAEKSVSTLLGSKYTGFCSTPNISNTWIDTTYGTCLNMTDYCKCIWIDSAPEGKKCQPDYSTKKVCESGTYDIGHCQYEISSWNEEGCNSGAGMISGTWTANWINSTNDVDNGNSPADCANIVNDNIPCDVVTKLSFFSWFNFILVILGIIGIYSFKKN